MFISLDSAVHAHKELHVLGQRYIGGHGKSLHTPLQPLQPVHAQIIAAGRQLDIYTQSHMLYFTHMHTHAIVRERERFSQYDNYHGFTVYIIIIIIICSSSSSSSRKNDP